MSTPIHARAVRSAIALFFAASVALVSTEAVADVPALDKDAESNVSDASTTDSGKKNDAGDSGPMVETGDYTGGGSFSECSAVPGVAAGAAPWLIAFGVALLFRKKRR